MTKGYGVLLIACIAAGSGACGNTAPRRGGTVLFASGADLQSINPLLTSTSLARQVQRYLLLTTLARYDSTLIARPYLAHGWRWSERNQVLSFDLRTDVRWHDGQPTTARDVVWTLEAARDPATGYPRQKDLSALSTVTAPNESTVILKFSSPQQLPGAIPDVLTDLAILPVHLLGNEAHAHLREAAWNAHPVGNGPFRFVAHDPNRRWVFERNSDFPISLGGPARIDRFILVVVDEPMAKLSALVAGELDFAGISPQHVAFVRRHTGLTIRDYPLIFPYGLLFNTRRSPFDDPLVRRAAAMAVNRKEIVEGYLFGFGSPAEGPVPPGLPGYRAEPPLPLAPDSARHLLAARRGPPPRVEILTVGSGEAPLEQMLQARLAAVGFEVTIRQLEQSAFLDRVYGPRHDFTAAVTGIAGDLGLGYMQLVGDLTGTSVPHDPIAAQRVFAEQMPVAWLYHGRGVQGMNARVHGVQMDVRGELPSVAQWRVTP